MIIKGSHQISIVQFFFNMVQTASMKSYFLSSLVEFLDYQLVNNIILFINVIICLSYPLNFAIYCGMSR